MTPWISLLTALPLIGGVALLGMPAERARWARGFALGCTAAALALTLGLWGGFDRAAGGMQWVERHRWIPALGVDYVVGIDGLGLLMLLLTALIAPMAVWASAEIDDRAPLYYALILFLEAGLFGTFSALNFFHWFLFWELSLVPAFFLVRFWGGTQRGPAATQFFVYTMVGSVAMLLGFVGVYLATGTFDLQHLAELGRAAPGQPSELMRALESRLGGGWIDGRTAAILVFGGIFLGLAVKVPVMPFHTWLPATYAEAPSAVTMLLTGAMSKMGVYGLLRVLQPLFPDLMREAAPLLLGLAVATILCSAGAAFVQKDLKRVLAYSSINHLGYCLLGVFAVSSAPPGAGTGPHQISALSGVLAQAFNHGITAAALFGFVGLLERRAAGRRDLEDFGGLLRVMPVFCGLMGLALFASLGLPGLNGFIGEFLIFQGAFGLAGGAASVSLLGLLITAVFLLTLMQRMFHGPTPERWAGMTDLSWPERLAMIPALALMLLIGLYPQALMAVANPAVRHLLAQLSS